jgi:hypothetical protein
MDGIGDHHVEQNKPSSQSQILYIFTHRRNLESINNNDNNNNGTGV